MQVKVWLTLGFAEDADLIEAFLETPPGQRAALVREALRYCVRDGMMAVFRRMKGLEG